MDCYRVFLPCHIPRPSETIFVRLAYWNRFFLYSKPVFCLHNITTLHNPFVSFPISACISQQFTVGGVGCVNFLLRGVRLFQGGCVRLARGVRLHLSPGLAGGGPLFGCLSSLLSQLIRFPVWLQLSSFIYFPVWLVVRDDCLHLPPNS